VSSFIQEEAEHETLTVLRHVVIVHIIQVKLVEECSDFELETICACIRIFVVVLLNFTQPRVERGEITLLVRAGGS
jgi:hypothetical protein